MAQRRMLSRQITETDLFMEMPLTAQALYLHLVMNADDDGFIGNTKMLLRTVGASPDDFKILLAKQFIIEFDDGITVIRDWRVHNYIQKDRYKKTMYSKNLSELSVTENGSYELLTSNKPLHINVVEPMDTECIQNGYSLDTQVRLGKDRLVKDKDIMSGKKTPDHIPYQEIIDYLNKKTKSNFRASGAANKRLIKARWNENYRLDDFKRVIDNMSGQWLGTEMANYLQPSTLFGSKFDNYLNKKTKTKLSRNGPNKTVEVATDWSQRQATQSEFTPEQIAAMLNNIQGAKQDD